MGCRQGLKRMDGWMDGSYSYCSYSSSYSYSSYSSSYSYSSSSGVNSYILGVILFLHSGIRQYFFYFFYFFYFIYFFYFFYFFTLLGPL